MTSGKRPGELIDCVLCGGEGTVSEETAVYYGRPVGDCTCPGCNGRGKVPYRPLPPNPSQDPREDDWVCSCGHRCRQHWVYCPLCGYPQPE